MKALRFTSENVAAVEEIPVPEIGPDEVLIASRAVGVCHSDIELLEGRYIIPFSYPIIPGHEWSGEVAQVGRDVCGFAAGDRVVGECVIGEDHFGFSISGAAAEYFVAKPQWLHKLPDSVSFTSGALVEPFSCGYYALMRAENVNASDVVVVLGTGPIGLGVVAGASGLGAKTIAVDPSPERREAALRLGAHSAVDPSDLDRVLSAESGGRGADVVIEASGIPEVMATALKVAAHRGRVVYIGINVGRSAPAELGLIQSKELTIRGSIGSPGVWPATLRFLESTSLDLGQLVTKTLPLDEALTALKEAQETRENIKVHLQISG